VGNVVILGLLSEEIVPNLVENDVEHCPIRAEHTLDTKDEQLERGQRT